MRSQLAEILAASEVMASKFTSSTDSKSKILSEQEEKQLRSIGYVE